MTTEDSYQSSLLSIASRIAMDIRSKIRGGTYSFGQKIPTERQLCDLYSASRGTIRKAIEILETERLLIRQQGRGTFVANPAHSRLKSSTTTLIGILVTEREYYFEPVINAASAQASQQGYALATGINSTLELETKHIDAFIKNDIRGIIMTPRAKESTKNYERILENNIPVVFMDTLIPQLQEDYVSIDNRLGTYIAAEHLIKLGHRNIAYLGHCDITDYPLRPERRRGYIEACNENNLNICDGWILETDDKNYPSLLANILKQQNRPTAFICYNDLWAIRLIKVAKKLKINVPQQLSVIGFDDSILASSFSVPITSVTTEKIEMGTSAVELIIKKIESPNQKTKKGIFITPGLNIRKSTAKPS